MEFPKRNRQSRWKLRTTLATFDEFQGYTPDCLAVGCTQMYCPDSVYMKGYLPSRD